MPHMNIVIIEDDADLRETLKELLEIEGFSVLAAENGREGLKLIERNGKPCLILLDLMMPVMNGWEFLDAMQREQQAILAETKVALLTAASEMTDLPLQFGYSLLKKPVDVASLYALAHAACDGC